MMGMSGSCLRCAIMTHFSILIWETFSSDSWGYFTVQKLKPKYLWYVYSIQLVTEKLSFTYLTTLRSKCEGDFFIHFLGLANTVGMCVLYSH